MYQLSVKYAGNIWLKPNPSTDDFPIGKIKVENVRKNTIMYKKNMKVIESWKINSARANINNISK